MEITILGIAIAVSFVVSLCAIKLTVPLAYRIGLVDTPTSRKRHTGDVPLIGGIAVFLGMLTSTTVIYQNNPALNLYIISSALIVFIGVLDDYKELTVGFRLVAQTLVSCIMVYGAGIYLANLGDIWGFGGLELSFFGYPITILAVIAAINAFNMTDGIDGLVGVLSLVAFAALAVLMSGSLSQLNYLPIIMAFATFPYLAFNLGFAGGSRKKIFMGDAGSMFVGLSIVWLLVSGSQGETPSFRPVMALWIIAVPLLDMLSLTIRRIQRKHSPFKADRDHIHHLLMAAGLTPKQTLLVISLGAVATVSSGVVMELKGVSEVTMFWSFVFLFIVYHQITVKLSGKQLHLKGS